MALHKCFIHESTCLTIRDWLAGVTVWLSRRLRRDMIQVNGQRKRRRRGAANFYFNFQVRDMIWFVPCKNDQRDLLLRFEEEGGKCEPVGFLSLHPPFSNWKLFSFPSFFGCHRKPDQSVTIRTQVGALPDQPPETGAHSLLEHVFELSSLCWSQRWEGKLTCNLGTEADQKLWKSCVQGSRDTHRRHKPDQCTAQALPHRCRATWHVTDLRRCWSYHFNGIFILCVACLFFCAIVKHLSTALNSVSRVSTSYQLRGASVFSRRWQVSRLIKHSSTEQCQCVCVFFSSLCNVLTYEYHAVNL